MLINEVTRAAEPTPETQWIQVFDDYHAVGASEVHDAMTLLLEHLPTQFHLVVATRSDRPLPLARLRTRGQLAELRAADLRLTRSEAREFLNGVMGLDLTTGDVDSLGERTEGWFAGLQLAGLSLLASASAAGSALSSRRSPAATVSSSTISRTRC